MCRRSERWTEDAGESGHPRYRPAEGKPAVDVGVSASGQGVAVNLGGGASYSLSNNRFEARKLTMASLSSNLERYLDRPVVDISKLTGQYDFTLDLTEEDYRSMMIRSAMQSGISCLRKLCARSKVARRCLCSAPWKSRDSSWTRAKRPWTS